MPKERHNNNGRKVAHAPYSIANSTRKASRDVPSPRADESVAEEEFNDAVMMNGTEGDAEIKLPAEIWGMVLDCKCCYFVFLYCCNCCCYLCCV